MQLGIENLERLAQQLHQERLAQLKLHISKLNDLLQYSLKTIKKQLKLLQEQFKYLIEQEMERLQQQTPQTLADINDFTKELHSLSQVKFTPSTFKGIKQLVLKSYFLTSDASVFSYKNYLTLSDDAIVQFKRFDLIQRTLLDQININTDQIDKLQIFNSHPKKMKFPNLIHVYCIDIKHDGQLVAVGGHPDTIYISDPISELVVKTLKTAYLEILALKFSQDGSRLAAGGSYPYEVCVWSCNNWDQNPLILKAQHLNQINRLEFLSKYLYVASDDFKLRVWKFNQMSIKNYQEYVGHWDSIYGLSVCGKKIATTGKDKTICVWHKNKLIKQWIGHDSEYGGYCVDYSLDGNILVSSGYEKIIKIWNAQNDYELIRQFNAHTEPIWTLGLNGNFIITASWDNTIKVWDLQNGKCLYTLENHFHSCPSINMKCFPLQFLATNGDGFIMLWTL